MVLISVLSLLLSGVVVVLAFKKEKDREIYALKRDDLYLRKIELLERKMVSGSMSEYMDSLEEDKEYPVEEPKKSKVLDSSTDPDVALKIIEDAEHI